MGKYPEVTDMEVIYNHVDGVGQLREDQLGELRFLWDAVTKTRAVSQTHTGFSLECHVE